jgi:hypothetical protein
MKPLTLIRRTAIAKANRLQRAARHLDTLRPAFEAWAAGEIYVCKRTGTYRFRFGADSKSVAPWDAIAREIFATPADFAFAATVLAAPAPELPGPAAAVTPKVTAVTAGVTPARVNVIALAERTTEEAA